MILRGFYKGENNMTDGDNDLILLTADIVVAHVSHNNVAVSDIAGLIGVVHATMMGLGGPAVMVLERQEPAVPIRNSVKPDYIVCLEDGKKFKTLKRHLMSNFGLTPDDYRAKWGLAADYPMVAPNYTATRSAIAFKIGLGRKRGESPKRRK